MSPWGLVCCQRFSNYTYKLKIKTNLLLINAVEAGIDLFYGYAFRGNPCNSEY
jgi:hypothetical protein